MKNLFFLAVLATIPSLSSIAAYPQQPMWSYEDNVRNETDTYPPARSYHQIRAAYPQDSARTEEDRQLNQRIRDKLSIWFTSGYNDTIFLRTVNGSVTLEGSVEKSEDIPRIVDTVRNTNGVTEVANHLSVKSQL